MWQNLPAFTSCSSNFVLDTSEQQQTTWAGRKLAGCDKDIKIMNYPAIRPDNANYPAGYRIVEKSTIRPDSLSGASLQKHVKNRHFSRHFATLPWFSEFCFLTDFDASKSVLGSFFAFFVKIWPKNMYRSSKSRNFFVWPFSPGDLRWPWPLLWSQSTGNDT